MQELVVLVDDQNNPIGYSDKLTVHTTNTPLHRAFSLFLFNSNHQILLTKRAANKKTFPGVWTNTVCGHLAPDESTVDAASRRLRDELGIDGVALTQVAPYRYRFADSNGIVENEICPIIVGFYDGDPVPNPSEVDEWKWMDWEVFLKDLEVNASIYSPWSREEAQLLTTKLPQKDLGQR